MILLPAVDIRDGRAVRLERGDYAAETVYAADPLEAARTLVEGGARALHVVDLDGARHGEPVNLHHLRRIVGELQVRVQYGGGLRSIEAVEEAREAGAERVVLGTAAHSDPGFLSRALHACDGRVVVAVDVRDGQVSVAGWSQETAVRAEEAIARLAKQGVESFVYTSVDRDGTLEGPDLDEVERVSRAVPGIFVYSGGVGSLDHLRGLRGLGLGNLVGVIAGKALYERRFTVAEGQAALHGEG